jgi:hypothetical protein
LPLLIIRTAADKHAPLSESQAIFDAARSASPVMLLEWDGLSRGQPVLSFPAHSLFRWNESTAVLVDRWLNNPGWLPPVPKWEKEERRREERLVYPTANPTSPPIIWDGEWEPDDPERPFTNGYTIAWRASAESKPTPVDA